MSWAQPDLREQDADAIRACFGRNWISQGEQVAAFEQQVARVSGRTHAVAVNSGSAALVASLIALGIGRDDEVIVPAMTFIAVPFAVSLLGAVPVLADIDLRTAAITADTVRPCLSLKTRAVIAVDYSGFAACWDGLAALCEEHGADLLVDAASSFLAETRGRPAGSAGRAATFSFHSAKTVTTGEGGAVVTDDADLAERLRCIRSHGEMPGRKYCHEVWGTNLRMTDMAAALGLAQLRRAGQIIEQRRAVVAQYLECAAISAAAMPLYLDTECRPNGFTFTVTCEERDRMCDLLLQEGIETRSMWPLCVDEQPFYRTGPLRAPAPIERARRFAATCLSLPVHQGVGPEAVRRIARVFSSFESAA